MHIVSPLFLRSQTGPDEISSAILAGRVERVPILGQRPEVRGRGPKAAIAQSGLASMTHFQRLEFLAQARVDQVLGSCALSLPSWLSGIRCYFAFADAIAPTRKLATCAGRAPGLVSHVPLTWHLEQLSRVLAHSVHIGQC